MQREEIDEDLNEEALYEWDSTHAEHQHKGNNNLNARAVGNSAGPLQAPPNSAMQWSAVNTDHRSVQGTSGPSNCTEGQMQSAFKPFIEVAQAADAVASQPVKARRDPQSIVSKVTSGLVQTYQTSNQTFTYNQAAKPRRVLTKPSLGVKNEGFDNENSDLILYVGDVLLHNNPSSGINRKYVIQEMLGQVCFEAVGIIRNTCDSCFGSERFLLHVDHFCMTRACQYSCMCGTLQGTFGQVVSCLSEETGVNMAVKIIKNQPAYYHQVQFNHTICQMHRLRNIVHAAFTLVPTFTRRHMHTIMQLPTGTLHYLSQWSILEQNGCAYGEHL